MRGVFITCKTREEWLENRKGGIGASEAAAVLGLSPFTTPLGLWAEKRGVTVKEIDETSEWIEWGQRLEDPIAKKFSETTRLRVESCALTIVTDEELPFLFASLDFKACQQEPTKIATGEVEVLPLEIKTSGGWNEDDWRDEPPIHVQVQVQFQMMVTQTDKAFVAVLLGGRKFKWYEVKRNQEFIDVMRRKCIDFWKSVQEDRAPVATSADSTVVSKLYPKEGGEQTIELDGECAEIDARRESLKAEIKSLEDSHEQLTNIIKQKIGLNSQGVLPNGIILRWQTQQRKEVVVAATEFRVLRRLKPRSAQ